LAIAIGGGAAAICIGTSIQTMLAVATLLGLTALALYGRDILHVYRTRKRRLIELNSRMAAFALVNLAAVVVLTLFLIVFDKLDAHIGTVVLFFSFGWLSGLALAKLYKIVAFLTWLEYYGPVLGKMATPRVQDLAVEPRALRWYLLYFTAVWASTGSLLVGLPLVFRIAAAIMLVSTVGIVAELVRIRRLADVKPTLRLPASVSRPRLFSSFSQHA
jgi:hypothetical protein